MKTRNTNHFVATLSGFRATAWGQPVVLPWVATVDVYQARVSPELWRARPSSGQAGHVWEASSAVDLMVKISGDFAAVLKPWTEFTRQNVCVGPVRLPAAELAQKRSA